MLTSAYLKDLFLLWSLCSSVLGLNMSRVPQKLLPVIYRHTNRGYANCSFSCSKPILLLHLPEAGVECNDAHHNTGIAGSRPQRLALFKSPSGGGLTETSSVTFYVPSGTFFFVFVGSVTSENMFWEPKTSHYARFWAQNARKTIDRHGKCRKLVFMHNLTFVTETLNNASSKM